jgi:photosystem II stability/assembly factor-like uncharacterized protein
VVVPGGGSGYPAFSMIDARIWLTFVPNVERTTDGGQHWEVLTSNLPANTYATELDFQDLNHGWAAAIVGTAHPTLAIYQTSDGGAHWTALTAPALGGQTGGG